MHTRPLLVVGNWKLNPTTLPAAATLATAVAADLSAVGTAVDVAVAPPFPFLETVGRALLKTPIALAAQTMFAEPKGAHTGEVSLPMLESMGVSTVILGHSERRARGERNEDINAAARVALKHKLTTIICVGERERDDEAAYFSVVEAELLAAFADIPKTHLVNLVIAYEPIWAIGTGATATPADVHEMKLFIQKVIADRFGRPAIGKVRIIYGGSVQPQNAADLLEAGTADGFLIGGASLRAKDFTDIIKTTVNYAKRAV